MPVNITNRADAEAIIREQIVSNIFQDAPKQSVFMSMARKLPNMASNQTRIRVLDFLPTAYWVNGDTGMKQTTRQAWDNVFINAGELAVIVPISDAVLSDAEFDIFGEVTPRVMEAIGQKVDAAVIFGDNRPAEWGLDIISRARQAGNNVSPATGKDYYDLILGENGVFAKVEDDGYGVTGALAPMNFKSKLRGLRDTTGQPIFKSNMQDVARYSLDGAPITFPENGAFYANIAQLVVGDFSQAVYAIRQDITVKILDQGVIQDPDTKEIIYNLAQQDMTALRIVFRMGWALPNPATRLNEDRTGCAFAYLEPGTPTPTQKVTFTVTDGDAESPKPRKGARINVEGAILTTDDNGKAEFNLRPGTYTAKISLKGCVSVTETVVVDAAAVDKAITLATQS
jgi:HK97 family phage major capsid protein